MRFWVRMLGFVLLVGCLACDESIETGATDSNDAADGALACPHSCDGATDAWSPDAEVVDPHDSAMGANDASVSASDGSVPATSAPNDSGAVVSDASASTLLAACGKLDAEPATLLAVGHNFTVDVVHRWQDRVLSHDVSNVADSTGHRAAGGHWVVWEASTGKQVADGLGTISPREGLFVTQTKGVAELHSLMDGAVLRTVPLGAQLSLDATYLWRADATGLTAWSLTGEVLASKAGAYPAVVDTKASNALVVAMPTELRVAKGPAGASVIESLSLSGTATLSPPFEGEFLAWFADGERFITRAGGDLVRVYTAAAVREQLFIAGVESQPRWMVGGYKSHFWIKFGKVRLYKVGVQEPVHDTLDGPEVEFKRPLLFVRASNGTSVADLDSPTPTFSRQPLQSTTLGTTLVIRDLVAGAGASNSFVFTPERLDSQGRLIPFGCGTAVGIAGSRSGRIAVATSDGKIRVFDLPSVTPTHVIDYQAASLFGATETQAEQFLTRAIDLSHDGRWLLARNRTTAVAFSLVDATPREVWRISFPDHGRSSSLSQFALARAAGKVLAFVCDGYCTRSVVDLTNPQSVMGSTRQESSNYIGISPNAAHVAITTTTNSGQGDGPPTLLYTNGALTNSIDNAVNAGWLSDSHFMVNRQQYNGVFWVYRDTAVLSADGVVRNTFVMDFEETAGLHPYLYPCRPRDMEGEYFYCPNTGKIFDGRDGSTVWSGVARLGDTVGQDVVQLTTTARVTVTRWGAGGP